MMSLFSAFVLSGMDGVLGVFAIAGVDKSASIHLFLRLSLDCIVKPGWFRDTNQIA